MALIKQFCHHSRLVYATPPPCIAVQTKAMSVSLRLILFLCISVISQTLSDTGPFLARIKQSTVQQTPTTATTTTPIASPMTALNNEHQRTRGTNCVHDRVNNSSSFSKSADFFHHINVDSTGGGDCGGDELNCGGGGDPTKGIKGHMCDVPTSLPADGDYDNNLAVGRSPSFITTTAPITAVINRQQQQQYLLNSRGISSPHLSESASFGHSSPLAFSPTSSCSPFLSKPLYQTSSPSSTPPPGTLPTPSSQYHNSHHHQSPLTTITSTVNPHHHHHARTHRSLRSANLECQVRECGMDGNTVMHGGL